MFCFCNGFSPHMVNELWYWVLTRLNVLWRRKKKKSISVVRVVCFDILLFRRWARSLRFISLLKRAEDGALYLRHLWRVQIFPMVIKVVMITVLRTRRSAALSCHVPAATGWQEPWIYVGAGRVVSELLSNNPLYITLWRTLWQAQRRHSTIWFDFRDLFTPTKSLRLDVSVRKFWGDRNMSTFKYFFKK